MSANSHNDGWQERLGFASGTILLWAVVLIKLLPLAAEMELSQGIEAVDSTGYANADLPMFWLLTLLGALGIIGLLLTTLHVGARGLWLASTTGGKGGMSTENMDRFCQRTFVSVFSTAKYAALLLALFPVMFVAVVLQHGLHRLFDLNSHAGGVVLYILAILMVLGFPTILFTIRVIRDMRSGGPWRQREPIMRLYSWFFPERDGLAVFPVILLFVVAANLTFYLSYTVDVQVVPNVSFGANAAVDVNIRLGGTTSDTAKAHLSLVNSRGELISSLKPLRLDPGNYALRVDLSKLLPGVYGIVLEYPYIDVSLVPLHVIHLRRERWFLRAN
jgi:hypothetical protein